MICRSDAYSLKFCERGAALVEFAMLLPVLCLLIIGTLEVGYRIYAVSVSNGAIRAAARMASTGQYTGTQIDAEVVKQIRSFRKDATVSIVKKSYSDFTGVGLPEPVTSGSIASGTYCFDDINNNGTWDADRGKTVSGGRGRDLLRGDGELPNFVQVQRKDAEVQPDDQGHREHDRQQ
ncbi:pilus assembly protein [Sphingomonas daechungensis]|uniref:Pilus assembly protein n=1 Tax=Sphingomonas daechungensis TaxID=1176646 RepID=A0ABX6T2T4_9SPHN|nr:TadE family protein [Sphingomonas daechungensis]QNP43212.1 pilus assembly protein [Sphingomonas daechungensis]